MESLFRLVQSVKKNNYRWDVLFSHLQTLIQHYVKKLFFLDARQEVYIAIYNSVRSMKYCNSDGECLKYIQKGVYYAFADLCKNNLNEISEVSWEEHSEYYSEYCRNQVSQDPCKLRQIRKLIILRNI